MTNEQLQAMIESEACGLPSPQPIAMEPATDEPIVVVQK